MFAAIVLGAVGLNAQQYTPVLVDRTTLWPANYPYFMKSNITDGAGVAITWTGGFRPTFYFDTNAQLPVINFVEGNKPATPDTGDWKIYFKTDGLYFVGDDDVEVGPLGGAGGGTPGGATGMPQFKSGASFGAISNMFWTDAGGLLRYTNEIGSGQVIFTVPVQFDGLNTNNGTIYFPGLTASRVLALDANKALSVESLATGTGALVRDNSATLTTPAIGDFTSATHDHEDNAGGGALDAAAIASGVLDMARLATGTPDGTQFIRDDGTLAVPAGSGGAITNAPTDFTNYGNPTNYVNPTEFSPNTWTFFESFNRPNVPTGGALPTTSQSGDPIVYYGMDIGNARTNTGKILNGILQSDTVPDHGGIETNSTLYVSTILRGPPTTMGAKFYLDDGNGGANNAAVTFISSSSSGFVAKMLHCYADLNGFTFQYSTNSVGGITTLGSIVVNPAAQTNGEPRILEITRMSDDVFAVSYGGVTTNFYHPSLSECWGKYTIWELSKHKTNLVSNPKLDSIWAGGSGSRSPEFDENQFAYIGAVSPKIAITPHDSTNLSQRITGNTVLEGDLAMGATTILSDSAGTTTLQNIDVIDATTETTLEAALDLISLQGGLNTNVIHGLSDIGTPASADTLILLDRSTATLVGVDASEFLGAASQTPWASDIDGANQDLTDVRRIGIGTNAAAEQIHILANSPEILMVDTVTGNSMRYAMSGFQTDGDVQMALGNNGGNRWLLGDSSAAYSFIPAADSAQDIGSYTVRVRTNYNDAVVTGTLLVEGNTSIGDAATDLHTVNGRIIFPPTPVNAGTVIRTNEGSSQWLKMGSVTNMTASTGSTNDVVNVQILGDGNEFTFMGMTYFSRDGQTDLATISYEGGTTNFFTTMPGVREQVTAATIFVDATKGQVHSITDFASTAMWLVFTNMIPEQEMKVRIAGAASGGSNYAIIYTNAASSYWKSLNAFGVTRATTMSETLTNGNDIEISVVLSKMRGTNDNHLVSRQYKH